MKEIKFNGKPIKIEKDVFSYIMGGMLILLSFGIAGLAAYVKMGFDPSALKTIEFWVSYAINLAMIYTCLFGVFIIRRQVNMKSSKMVLLRSSLRSIRSTIVKNDKIDACKSWLEAYNYEEKINIYSDILDARLERLHTDKPDDCGIKWIHRRRQRRYEKAIAKERQLRGWVKNIAVHNAAVDLMYRGKGEEAKLKLDELPEDDAFRRTRIAWRNVTYTDLFSFAVSHSQKQTIFSNERKATLAFIVPMLITSVIASMLMSSLVGGEFVSTSGTIMTLLINLASLCMYTVNGIRMADKVIFQNVYPAEQTKQELCEAFMERDRANGGRWETIAQQEK